MKVDIIIGGDHGGGKFRMSMKVNFHLAGKKTHSYLTQIAGKKTHSYLTQIANVSFSKDKLEILKETVLDPIGVGLQLVVSGGKFVVIDSEYKLQFSTNTSDTSIHCNCPVQVYLAGDLKFYAHMSGREYMSSFW
jgi:predicted ATP-dependent serine protease